MLLLYLKISLMLDGLDMQRWTLISFGFFAMMLYVAGIELLKILGVKNTEYYKVKVIKDDVEKKMQPFGAIIFIQV